MSNERVMQGYKLTFFTQQNRRRGDASLAEWILDEAKRLGVRGATVFTAAAGYGRDGRFHSADLFDLADEPQQVVMAVSPEEAERLFARIKAEGVRVFYTKTPVEFGVTGEE
jgi:PII-like signaling protein